MSTRPRSVELVPIIVFLLLRILLLLSSFGVNPLAEGARAFQVAKTNCTDTCGNVTIPYPFGIGTGCFLDDWYEVVCLQVKNNTSVPRLKKIRLDVLAISLPEGADANPHGRVRVNYPIFSSSPNCTDNVLPSVLPSLSGSNFFFSSKDRNVFTAIGCNQIASMNINNSAIAACRPVCVEGSRNGSRVNDCLGNGCCQSTLFSDVQAFNISLLRVDQAATPSGDGCSYAFVVDRYWFESNSTDLYSLRNLEFVPVTLGWGIGNDIWSRLNDFGRSSYCSAYLAVTNYDSFPFRQCYCKHGYEGNAYLGDQGCQDIDECEDPRLNGCPGKCSNVDGSYNCDGVSRAVRAVKLAMMVIGGFVGAVFFLLSARWLRRTIKKRRKMKLKQKFFKQNGGLLLQQQLASPEGNIEKSKVFNSKDLERATDNFNENRILGQGGQGTVYKGMLVDGRIVAIKKSKMLHREMLNSSSMRFPFYHRPITGMW